MNTVLGSIACSTLALTALPVAVKAAVSNPFSSKGDIGSILPDYQEVKETEKKYYEHKIEKHHEAKPILNTETLENSCNIGVRSKWSSTVGSGIFAAPVTYPSGIDGKKEIFVNTFYQYVEVLGHDGYKPWGFPLSFEDSSFQTGPVLYDVDDDGVNDMGVVDKNGNLFWIRLGEFGQYLEDYHVQVPKLKIKKDWADGMDPKFEDNYIMTSMFDHDYAPFQKTGSKAKHDELEALPNANQASYPEQNSNEGVEGRGEGGGRGLNGLSESRMRMSEKVWQGRQLFSVDSPDDIEEQLIARHKEEVVKNHVISMQEKTRRIKEDSVGHHSDSVNTAAAATTTEDHDASQKQDRDAHEKTEDAPVRHSLHIATPDELIRDSEEELQKESHGGSAAIPNPEHHVEVKAHSTHREHVTDDDLNPNSTPPNEWIDDDYHVDPYHEFEARHHYGMHGDDMGYGMGYGGFGGFNESNFVFVDPHVLSTPVLADVNNDGDAELVMAVSYYFDKFAIEHRDKLDYDPDNFIAGGIASWNIAKEEWSWLVHLDLTTDKTKFNALIYSSPTVADIDGDGRKEIIIGTSLGLLYVLDGDSGFTRRFFPMQFHQIQAQVTVGDIMGGSHLEMIVGDLVGNLVCVNGDGDILWDTRLSGAIYHAATIGDVNGDGQLDVIVSVAALEGYLIYAVHGDTGKVLPQFPIALPSSAEISGPILLVDVYSYMSPESTVKTSYTAGIPGGTVAAKPTRSYGVSSTTYDDPYVPKWTMDSRGHEPALAPSENIETETETADDINGDGHDETGGLGNERKLSSIRGSKEKEKGRLSEREYANEGLSAEDLKLFMEKSKSGVGGGANRM